MITCHIGRVIVECPMLLTGHTAGRLRSYPAPDQEAVARPVGSIRGRRVVDDGSRGSSLPTASMKRSGGVSVMAPERRLATLVHESTTSNQLTLVRSRLRRRLSRLNQLAGEVRRPVASASQASGQKSVASTERCRSVARRAGHLLQGMPCHRHPRNTSMPQPSEPTHLLRTTTRR